MNVILLNGIFGINALSRTIGPYKTAHWLRKHNYTAQVIDFIHFLNEDTLYKLTKKFINNDTKIIGLSTTFMVWTHYDHSDGNKHRYPEYILNVLKRIKLEFPKIKIVTGGYQSDTLPSYGIIDASIMSYTGASEEILLEYLEHLIHGTPPPPSTECFRDPERRPLFNNSSTQSYNIEQDDFKFTKQDCILPGEPLPIDISRGCIFACKFCQHPHLGKKKYDYVRGMEYIEAEMLHNYSEFGTTSYYLLDDTFNDTERKIKEFHAMTSQLPFKINFVGYLRADLIDRFPDTAHMLKESGLLGAFFGIETLHPEASRLIGKAWSGTHAKTFVPELYHNIWNKEIPIHTNFIVGITHDTKENILDTVKWFKDNNLHSIVFESLGIYGGKDQPFFEIKSEFDRNPEKYGYVVSDPVKESRFPNWSNNNWTIDEARSFRDRLNNMIEPDRGLITWALPVAHWYGASREDLINFKLPQVKGMLHKLTNTKELMNTYVQLLLGVK